MFSHLLKRCAERNGDVDVGNVELVGADELAKKNSRGMVVYSWVLRGVGVKGVGVYMVKIERGS